MPKNVTINLQGLSSCVSSVLRPKGTTLYLCAGLSDLYVVLLVMASKYCYLVAGKINPVI